MSLLKTQRLMTKMVVTIMVLAVSGHLIMRECSTPPGCEDNAQLHSSLVTSNEYRFLATYPYQAWKQLPLERNITGTIGATASPLERVLTLSGHTLVNNSWLPVDPENVLGSLLLEYDENGFDTDLVHMLNSSQSQRRTYSCPSPADLDRRPDRSGASQRNGASSRHA